MSSAFDLSTQLGVQGHGENLESPHRKDQGLHGIQTQDMQRGNDAMWK